MYKLIARWPENRVLRDSQNLLFDYQLNDCKQAQQNRDARSYGDHDFVVCVRAHGAGPIATGKPARARGAGRG